jgi:hypothetical protein
MARQSFHAVRKPSALTGSSYKSATSRIRLPSELLEVSVNKAKNALISPAADMALFLYDEMELRKELSFEASF